MNKKSKQKKIDNKPEKLKVPKFKKELGFTTTEQRSQIMKKIKSYNTKYEVLLRKELWKNGVRYRINVKKLPGSPDIVINKHKLIVFVDGEFWHGHNWLEKREKIKSNRNFWIPKIERNMERDLENNKALKTQGYKVLRFWEHELKKDINKCLRKILRNIK